MRWLRYLVRGINIIAAILLVAIGVTAWMLASESGTAWLVATIAKRVAPTLSIGAISGTLLDELRLERIEYRSAGNDIDCAELVASFDLFRVLSGGLVIDDLHLTAVRYRRTGAIPAARGEASASAPLALIVRNGVIDGIALETPENDLRFGRFAFAGRWIEDELLLERFETTLGEFSVSGQLTLELQQRLGIAGTANWGGTIAGQEYLGSVTLTGRLPELAVEHELRAPFPVSTQGTVWIEERPRVDLDFTWRDAAVTGVGSIASPTGVAKVTGPVDRLEFDTAGTLELVERPFEFDASGVLDGAVVLIDRLRLTDAAGTATARGDLELDTTQWQLTLEAENLDPGAYVPDWSGRIGAAGGFAGKLKPELELETRNLRLSGTVRDRPFDATARGALRETRRLEIDELSVSSGEDRLTVRGVFAEAVDLSISASLGEIQSLWEPLSGRGRAEMTVTGTSERPLLRGEITLDDGRYGDLSFGHVGVTGSAVGTADGELDLEIDGRTLAIGRLGIDGLRGTVAGRSSEHTLTLEAVAAQWSASMAARGGLDERLWRGTVDSLRTDQSVVGVWTLAAPAGVVLGPGALAVERSCLEQGGTSLCGELSLVGAPTDGMTLSAVDFDIRALQPFLPELVEVDGIYQLSARLVDLGGDPKGTLEVTGGATHVRLMPGANDSVAMDLDEASLGAELDDWALAVNVDLLSHDAGRLSVALAAGDIREENTEMLGSVKAFWPDLAALSALSPDIGAVSGTLAVDVDIAGTRAEPRLQGEARWNDGMVEVPRWGLVVEGIEARGTSTDGRTLEFTGAGLVAGGELGLQGSTELDPARRWPTRLRLTGDSLALVQTADAEIFVSPDLNVDVALPNLSVDGTLHVPRARIEIDELPSQAVRPSPDSRLHGVSAAPVARPLHTRAELLVSLGDDVHYSGSNLTTDVTGQMRLSYDSLATTNAIGTLTAAGSYDAYGQMLDLDRGELLFAGPLDNPALDIRAIRVVGEQTVGVELGGTLLAPEPRIYSSPALSEADALSYLMFGRPLSGTGEQESATLQSAAVALGLQQALPVVQRIGQTIGLDELSIATTDVDEGALMAGKYLSPKLYVRYSYGLFNRIGGLLVRFKVNEHLSIETRSGDQKSMDLLYTVEKD